jgi:hypothetical protein
MTSLKRQITEPEKQEVLAQQRRNGTLYCFVDDHPIDDEKKLNSITSSPSRKMGRQRSQISALSVRRTIVASALYHFLNSAIS